eukprot:6172012-Pleurochrysis_carterae.AAC.1
MKGEERKGEERKEERDTGVDMSGARCGGGVAVQHQFTGRTSHSCGANCPGRSPRPQKRSSRPCDRARSRRHASLALSRRKLGSYAARLRGNSRRRLARAVAAAPQRHFLPGALAACAFEAALPSRMVGSGSCTTGTLSGLGDLARKYRGEERMEIRRRRPGCVRIAHSEAKRGRVVNLTLDAADVSAGPGGGVKVGWEREGGEGRWVQGIHSWLGRRTSAKSRPLRLKRRFVLVLARDRERENI